MKKTFMSVDFEEWFHILYLKKYNFDDNVIETFADKTLGYLRFLSENNIKATVFVVGEIAQENATIIQEIHKMGHEIGCHSYKHDDLKQLSLEEFEQETKKAKEIIENIIGEEIIGYRAPAFSMTDDKLEIIKKLGFKYDSSYINSTANEFYATMNLNSYNKIEDLVYKNDGFYEVEIPTIKFLGKQFPIGGGGFFRIYPYFVYKFLLNKFLKTNDKYMFFIHPYEIAGETKFTGFKKISFIEKIRFQLGRKLVIKKIKKNIKYFQRRKYEFYSLKEYFENLNKGE